MKLGGRTEHFQDDQKSPRALGSRKGCHGDLRHPGPGYLGTTTNLLRLWKRGCRSFDFDAFNVGDYCRAVDQKVESETIKSALPNDEPVADKLGCAAAFLRVVLAAGLIRLHLAAEVPG